MPDEPKNMYRYRILRYTPNLIRDEWVNIGVLLEETGGLEDAEPARRRDVRIVEEDAEIGRVVRLHPNADVELLRGLRTEFDERLRASDREAAIYLAKLDQTLSNTLQFSPQKVVFADDFQAELDRLYHDHVTPPRGRSVTENARSWFRNKLNDVFRRHRILGKMERNVRIEEFTEPGDPFKFDYAYQNGVRGYIHSVVLGRNPAQAKVVAYTAESIARKLPRCEFTAITEIEPASANSRHQFITGLFAKQGIAVVPLNRVEKFAEELRIRLQ
ncbi:MAG: DUF3037 domain-containing protein [Candidatus Acidiferrales bacterium]